MRLYLSSFRVGDAADRLPELMRGGRRAAVIANAMDPYGRRGLDKELPALAALGIEAEELDLRDYFGDAERLRSDVERYDLLWVRGGNAFALRQAMAKSRADRVIVDLLARDAFVYGGYSAGPCVLAPSLRGLELCDDIPSVVKLYGEELVVDGLGVLDFAFVPHFDSPGHPETEFMNLVVAYYDQEEIPYRTFRDGQVLIRDGDAETLVG
jgi:dipeptidase E